MTENEPAQGTVINLRFESEILKDNPLGDPHIRDLFVYVPPGYEVSGRRYPTVYCLTGFTGRGKMLLNDNAFTPNFAERMDRLIGAGTIEPMIAVMPDCFTYYGGAQYINSTATGNYEDYLTQEIIRHVDENLRTIGTRDARAVMGKSSGGYGALVMAMRHADSFGLACSTAGDCYFEYCYMMEVSKALRSINGDPKAFIKRYWEVEKKENKDFPALNFVGMAASYSARGTEFDLPFDLETGEMRDDVWSRWLEHDPVRMVGKYVEALRSLRLLFIDAGTKDEFGLDLGARILSKRLNDHNIDHIHEEFDDGHFNISYRYDRSLQLISESIVTAETQSRRE